MPLLAYIMPKASSFCATENSQSVLGIKSARAKKCGDHAHSRPTLCLGVPRIFLTAPLSYEAVALHLGQCDKLLRPVKLATSSLSGISTMATTSYSPQAK